jgi:Protein of unknown function (DUF2934)
MATEEQIRELAYNLWEKEGGPEGKDQEHYFRAKSILEDQEKASVIELPASPPHVELAPPTKVASRSKRRRSNK